MDVNSFFDFNSKIDNSVILLKRKARLIEARRDFTKLVDRFETININSILLICHLKREYNTNEGWTSSFDFKTIIETTICIILIVIFVFELAFFYVKSKKNRANKTITIANKK